jgi:DAACS family dicarboxylate/amino acid:cation (Na+ or H+) symporter
MVPVHQLSSGPPRGSKFPLWLQIFIGLVIGVAFGFLWPDVSKTLAPVGTAFIKAIKMIVIPLVFSAVTLGIYTMGEDIKQLGRFCIVAFIWFYAATAICIFVAIGLNQIIHPAAGLELAQATKVPVNIASSINWVNFFLDIIPDNVVASASNQKIIPTLFFAVCFGLALAKAGEVAKPVINFLQGVLAAMFKVTAGVIAVSPLAVAAIMAWVIGSQGTTLLIAMAKLVGTLYLGLGVMLIVFLVLVRAFGYRPFDTLKTFSEPLLLAFTTCSSEVALPVHMRIMESVGIPRKIVSFVVPLGYSFNPDGSALYQALTTCFLAEAYGLHLDLPSLLTIMITTLIANKGTANVPAASLVVLAVVLVSIGLPVEAVAIVAGVDRFIDMGRTAVNILGNTIAPLAIIKFGGKGVMQDAGELTLRVGAYAAN